MINTLVATFSAQSMLNFVRIMSLTKLGPGSKLFYVGSISRSPGEIIEQASEHSRDHIFSPIIFKLGQNDVLDKI